ncbi:MAG: class I SAM-dependent methyltransferase [Candidatus Acidiferrales bacterium]
MRWKKALTILAVLLALASALAWWNRATLKRLAYGEGASRDEWQQPHRVLEALALRPGDRVADIGAGGGYFSFRFARAVGPEGRIYAVDVDRDMTTHMEKEAAARGLRNVSAILAAPDDPKIPEPVDLVFVSNTYHHITNRTEYFRRLRRQLRPDGRLAIIEYSGNNNWFARTFGHKTDASTIRSELEAAGYRLAEEHHFLPQQHFLIFSNAE